MLENLFSTQLLAELELLGRLVIALVAGGVLGWERERRDKPAGLRTHMLVALGAAGCIIATLEFLTDGGVSDTQLAVRADPIRAIAAVIGGVGFLGAGTIIQARASVHGITTAASIWVAATIGIAAGLGLYKLTAALAGLALLTLIVVGMLESRVLVMGTQADVDKRPVPEEAVPEAAVPEEKEPADSE